MTVVSVFQCSWLLLTGSCGSYGFRGCFYDFSNLTCSLLKLLGISRVFHGSSDSLTGFTEVIGVFKSILMVLATV